MKLSTPVSIEPFSRKLGLRDKVLTLGSCFSQVMGEHLSACKIETVNNPFGTIYNPVSIATLLEYSMGLKTPDHNGYIQVGEIHQHFDFHSDLSALSLEELKSQVEGTIGRITGFLKEADWLIITFGSSIVYRHQSSADIVANCHRVPRDQFRREMLSLEFLVQEFEAIHQKLLNFNPNLNVMVTVSPVRHTRDGLQDNAVSKATLRSLCHHLENEYEGIYYFPAFEIMMDELRDYRFYDSDLIHPNPVATAYIWERFKTCCFAENDLATLGEWEKIRKALEHRPRHPQARAHRKFLKETHARLEALNGELDLTSDLLLLEQEIQKKTD